MSWLLYVKISINYKVSKIVLDSYSLFLKFYYDFTFTENMDKELLMKIVPAISAKNWKNVNVRKDHGAVFVHQTTQLKQND